MRQLCTYAFHCGLGRAHAVRRLAAGVLLSGFCILETAIRWVVVRVVCHDSTLLDCVCSFKRASSAYISRIVHFWGRDPLRSACWPRAIRMWFYHGQRMHNPRMGWTQHREHAFYHELARLNAALQSRSLPQVPRHLVEDMVYAPFEMAWRAIRGLGDAGHANPLALLRARLHDPERTHATWLAAGRWGEPSHHAVPARLMATPPPAIASLRAPPRVAGHVPSTFPATVPNAAGPLVGCPHTREHVLHFATSQRVLESCQPQHYCPGCGELVSVSHRIWLTGAGRHECMAGTHGCRTKWWVSNGPENCGASAQLCIQYPVQDNVVFSDHTYSESLGHPAAPGRFGSYPRCWMCGHRYWPDLVARTDDLAMRVIHVKCVPCNAVAVGTLSIEHEYVSVALVVRHCGHPGQTLSLEQARARNFPAVVW